LNSKKLKYRLSGIAKVLDWLLAAVLAATNLLATMAALFVRSRLQWAKTAT
jgi:hypothetical protein